MYKKRFKKWGLKKNADANDMALATQKRSALEDSNDKAGVERFASLTEGRKLERFLKRKNLSLQQLLEEQTGGSASFIPSASAFAPIQSLVELELPERMLQCIYIYFRSSFDRGI